jgi:aryl-alcohol dehydrogenase-like predicted oxidoreductase
VDDRESIRAIHCALDHGITFFDTADAYGAGHSECILGEALKGRRAQAVISTKFGNVCDEAARRVTLRDGLAPAPDEIRQACQASLRRLQTDTIDLYHLHIWSIPFEDVALVLDTLDELVAQGHIRAYAWSTDLVEGARRFAERRNCAAVQFELNVLQEASDMLALCEAHDLAAVVRSPLAMGLLSGKYSANSRLPENDIRGNAPDWMKYFTGGRPHPDWYRQLEAVRAVLTSQGRTLAQGALAWVWGRSSRTIPIPGFKTVQQVEENAAALQFGPLRPEQMREIEALLGRQA